MKIKSITLEFWQELLRSFGGSFSAANDRGGLAAGQDRLEVRVEEHVVEPVGVEVVRVRGRQVWESQTKLEDILEDIAEEILFFFNSITENVLLCTVQ